MDNTSESSSFDEVRDGFRQKLVRRIAAADREANREIYDAFEDE